MSDIRLLLARRDYNNIWPKEIWTGVMFYDGLRITRKMFEGNDYE